MRIVRLHGELAKRFGRTHRLDVATPAEAIAALSVNHPGFREHLLASGKRGVGYRCIVDDEIADEDRICAPMSRKFNIAPVICGAGKLGAVLGIITGAALIAFAGPIAGFIGAKFLTASTVALIGVSLVASGIGQLLTPTPTINKDKTRNESQYFNGPQNLTAQGAAVPFGYGRAIVGSAVISAGITVEQQSTGAAAIGGFKRLWG